MMTATKSHLFRYAVLTMSLAVVACGSNANEPGGDLVAVSSLANLGNLAMQERASDPAAVDRALDHFDRANQLDSGHLNARFGLAWAKQVKGLPESQWRPLYEETVDEASLLTYFSLYNLAYAEQQAESYSEAIAFLQQALQVMPQRADGWLEMGRVHARLGQDTEAEAAWSRALRLDPGLKSQIDAARAR